ncbi:MAG: HAD-IB family hydrolase [Chlamydiia bacterium]|nr:HAD-IB family hydrolase [Chlamydiia bacterium]
MLKCNSGIAFFRYLMKRGVFPKRMWISAIRLYCARIFDRISVDELHVRSFELFLLGRYKAEVSAHVDTFLDEFLERAICFEVSSFCQRAMHLGHTVAIFSASPDYIVEPIAERLGIERIVATRYGTDKEGRFSHIEEVVTGRKKAFYARELIEELNLDKSQVRAYSDSIEDWPLLKAVGGPMAIRPDKRLNLLARRRKLPILE